MSENGGFTVWLWSTPPVGLTSRPAAARSSVSATALMLGENGRRTKQQNHQ